MYLLLLAVAIISKLPKVQKTVLSTLKTAYQMYWHHNPQKIFSKVIGWKDGQTLLAPKGFTVSRSANKLDNPRWIYAADGGDIFLQSLTQSFFFLTFKVRASSSVSFLFTNAVLSISYAGANVYLPFYSVSNKLKLQWFL